jgi:hypothetical protein
MRRGSGNPDGWRNFGQVCIIGTDPSIHPANSGEQMTTHMVDIPLSFNTIRVATRRGRDDSSLASSVHMTTPPG